MNSIGLDETGCRLGVGNFKTIATGERLDEVYFGLEDISTPLNKNTIAQRTSSNTLRAGLTMVPFVPRHVRQSGLKIGVVSWDLV